MANKNRYDKHIVARPIARLIQEKIKKPLAEQILFGKLRTSGRAELTVNSKGKLVFTYS